MPCKASPFPPCQTVQRYQVSFMCPSSVRYRAGIHHTYAIDQSVASKCWQILLQNVDVFTVVTSSKANRSQQWKVLVVQVHPWNRNIDFASRWGGKLCSRTPKFSQASLLLLTLQRWWDKLKQTETGAETNWPRNVLRDAKLTQLPWEVPNCFALGHQNLVRLVCNCYKGMKVRNIETGLTAAQAQSPPDSWVHAPWKHRTTFWQKSWSHIETL